MFGRARQSGRGLDPKKNKQWVVGEHEAVSFARGHVCICVADDTDFFAQIRMMRPPVRSN